MPTRSSDIGTEQESGKTEITMSSGKRTPKPAAEPAPPAEATVEPEATTAVSSSMTPEAATDETPTPAAEPDAPVLAEILQDGRERIDAIDDQILELVVRRMEIAESLLKAKHVRQINIRDKAREQDIFIRQVKAAAGLTDKDVNLNQHEIRELFELLVRLGVQNFRRNVINRR